MQLSHRLVLILLAWLCALPVNADSFLLKTGGRLEGELLNAKRKTEDPYELRTTDGVRLVLPREQVLKVFVKTNIEREYERLLPRMPDSAEGNWKMAEWCREVGLKSKRELHLSEVIKREPGHEAARLALGYQRFEGAWRKPEEQMARMGYVRYQGKWLTPQDIEISQAEAAHNAAIVEWRQKIRLWKSWLIKKRDLEARENFRGIRDPLAASALLEMLEDNDLPVDFRLLALDALEPLHGRPGEMTIVRLAVEDPVSKIREECIAVLERYESKRAVLKCVQWLKHEENLVVNRAAEVLRHLRDPESLSPLIDALNTTHTTTEVPGSANNAGGLGPINSSFSRGDDGGINTGPGSAGGMTFGSPRPVKVKREHSNDAVLDAITAIVPGVNFAFNEAAWKRWYVQEHEPAKVDLRRGN